MIRRVSFWCAVSAALTVVMLAVAGYAVVTKDRLIVSAPFLGLAAFFLGQQTGGLFFIRNTATVDDARAVSRQIGTATLVAPVVLVADICFLGIVFGMDSIALILGHVVLILAVLGTTLMSSTAVDVAYLDSDGQ